MRKAKATFSDEDRQLAIPIGKLVPLHLIKDCDPDEKGNDRFIYNPIFRIAPEAEIMLTDIPAFIYAKNDEGVSEKQPIMEEGEGDKKIQKKVNGKFLVGRDFKYQRIGNPFGGFSLLDQSLKKSERWKNQEYVDICEAIGVEFPENADGVKSLIIVEAEDIEGYPCMGRLGRVTVDKREKTGATDEKTGKAEWAKVGELTLNRIVEILPWEDGKVIVPVLESQSEDEAFDQESPFEDKD
jgi:hypothetical protein